MNTKKRKVGVFFSIENEIFVTEIDYKSKNQFEKLITNYTKNVEICDPSDNEQIKFVSIDKILDSALTNLPKKQKISKLIINLIAQNSENMESISG